MDLGKEDLIGSKQTTLFGIDKRAAVSTKERIDKIKDLEGKETSETIFTLSYNQPSYHDLGKLWDNFNDHFNVKYISDSVSEEELKNEQRQREIQLAIERENLLRSLGVVKLKEPRLNQDDPRLIKIGTPNASISYMPTPNNKNIYLIRTVVNRFTPGEAKMTESFVYIPPGKKVDVYIVHDLLKRQKASQI